MKNAKAIHPLALDRVVSGQIKFIHSDGKEHIFYSVVNRMSGDRLSAFDDSPPSINDALKWVRSVFRDIRAKAKVVKVIGDF
jgi:hypothetical protein